MYTPRDTERFNVGQADLEGQHKARTELFYRAYLRIYEANPQMLSDKYLTLHSAAIALVDQCDPPMGFGITINAGEIKDLEEFMKVFVVKFIKNIEKKYSIVDYSFDVEFAPKTDRLHCHGKIKRAETKSRLYPCDIQQQIFQCVPPYFIDRGFNTKHVHVEPIHNQKKWDEYCAKDPQFSFGKCVPYQTTKKSKK